MRSPILVEVVPKTHKLTFQNEGRKFVKINTKIHKMRKKYSFDWSFTYEITGRSGEKYCFNQKKIQSYAESVFSPLTEISFIYLLKTQIRKPQC